VEWKNVVYILPALGSMAATHRGTRRLGSSIVIRCDS
jgi:Na+-transporting NADH:ubiquinone oxidoreductase subunit NqrA